MQKSKDYQKYLLKKLKNSKYALEYLKASLEDGNPGNFSHSCKRCY